MQIFITKDQNTYIIINTNMTFFDLSLTEKIKRQPSENFYSGSTGGGGGGDNSPIVI